MRNTQIYVEEEPFRKLKEDITQKYSNVAFYEDQVNGIINIASGTLQNRSVMEKIVADGPITLVKKPHYTPSIVWLNQYVRLDNGQAISIEISESTFFIDFIYFGNMVQCDVHLIEESKEAIENALYILKHRATSHLKTNSITFQSPTILLLEKAFDKRVIREKIDLKKGFLKRKHYGRLCKK